MDHHRSQGRRQTGNEIEVHLVLHGCVDPSPDPEQKILNEERFRKLQSAFSQLTPRQRACLRLRAKGLRYREIALAMGMSVQRVGELMQRAISRIDLGSR
jgi:RNA polymerase sigma factor (sigma-70 family)